MINYTFRFKQQSSISPQYVACIAGNAAKEVKCTCGVKFTGGICSDWCDTNHPVEDTEELPF